MARIFAESEKIVEKEFKLVSCLVNKCRIADAAFDLMGGFGPAEGFGVFVPVGQEAGDGLL